MKKSLVRDRAYLLAYRTKPIRGYISVAGVPEFCPAGVLLDASKSTDMSLSHLSTHKCHRTGPESKPQPRAQKASAISTAPPRATIVTSDRQHSLKWVKGKRSNVLCPVVQQEEVESIHTSSYECTIVQCLLRGQSKQASLVYRSSTRVCVRNCDSIRRPEFECSGPQLEEPEFECSGPQLEGPEFEYSELSLKAARNEHFAKLYEDKLKVNGKYYDVEFCKANEDHPIFGLNTKKREHQYEKEQMRSEEMDTRSQGTNGQTDGITIVREKNGQQGNKMKQPQPSHELDSMANEENHWHRLIPTSQLNRG
ncbi:hypothetical protein ANN_23944 [Periplaneta americana]|uniref:Uncharacterized protein n=1 Tax=Periplaneta americana TaxID=6978 RepID=A0ABQ8S1R2_PERAM|nr:hypothetical protein ANN_23944 [Periplaneta americana]